MIKFSLDPREKYAFLETDRLDLVREHFSVKNTAAQFAKKINPFTPARFYAITPGGRFDPPLFEEIEKFFLSCGILEKVEYSSNFKKVALPSPQWTLQHTLALPLRDYQEDIVTRALSRGRGTVVLATAGGKTLVIASIVENIFRQKPNCKKAVIVVPDLGLVHQTVRDFTDYRLPLKVSKWTGSDPLDLSADVVVTNVGILQSANSDTDWLKYVDLLIVDECHRLRKGNKIVDIIHGVNTPHKYGFTGTLPDSKLDQWNIIGKIGGLICEINSDELRKRKFVSEVLVTTIELVYQSKPAPPTVSTPTADYEAELKFIIESEFRNNIIAQLASKTTNTTLILVDRIEHGQRLFDAISRIASNKKSWFIRGEVDVEDRQKVQAYMEQSTDSVVVAISKIFSTGINIKNLHYIIFAGTGGAKIQTIQSIGRGLRLHESKDRLLVFDISDRLEYSEAHLAKRLAYYAAERIPVTSRAIYEK